MEARAAALVRSTGDGSQGGKAGMGVACTWAQCEGAGGPGVTYFDPQSGCSAQDSD